MENTIIAREHSFNKGLKTATNRIIKATEQTAKSLMVIALTMVEIEDAVKAYRQHVDEGLVDFSGQGRDRYGR